MVTVLFKIATEIQVLNHILNESQYNLLPSQRKYLNEKLEDLIHSYLLEEKRKGLINVTRDKNLFDGDYSVESNRSIISTL